MLLCWKTVSRVAVYMAKLSYSVLIPTAPARGPQTQSAVRTHITCIRGQRRRICLDTEDYEQIHCVGFVSTLNSDNLENCEQLELSRCSPRYLHYKSGFLVLDRKQSAHISHEFKDKGGEFVSTLTRIIVQVLSQH